MEKKLIIKKILNIKLITNCFVFIYLFFMNLTYANENFIITTVNKFPISKIDVINKAKILLYSAERTADSNNLDKYYNRAIKDLINEKIVFSNGLKINEKIENLVTPKAESLLLASFNNSELQLNSFLKSLSIPKSALLEKYKTDLILGYIVKNKYKSQLKNIEKLVDSKINSRKKQDLFEIAEIVLNKKNNSTLYKEIQTALQNGANFLNIARQISISASSKSNGKIGWKTYGETASIIKTVKTNFLEGDVFSFSTKDKFYFYKILATRLNGKVSKKENKVLLVEVKFPINFRKKEQVYFDVKKRLSSLLSDKSKCNNLLVLKKSNKLKISMNTIKSRIADLSPNIEYLIKNLGLFEVSKPLFSGNVGFAYIICDTQNAENEENIKIKKNEMMNKHLLNLSNKILKRLIKQARISQIQKIN